MLSSFGFEIMTHAWSDSGTPVPPNQIRPRWSSDPQKYLRVFATYLIRDPVPWLWPPRDFPSAGCICRPLFALQVKIRPAAPGSTVVVVGHGHCRRRRGRHWETASIFELSYPLLELEFRPGSHLRNSHRERIYKLYRGKIQGPCWWIFDICFRPIAHTIEKNWIQLHEKLTYKYRKSEVNERMCWVSFPVPEFIDPVFTKTSPKRSFSLNRKRAFWLVFAKTGSIISGTGVSSI